MRHLILVVDSPTIQKLVQLCFKAEEIEVHCFVDGRSTLEYLKTQPADVLLADMSIPDLDGYELCRAVKQNPRTASLPVVLLVGVFDSFDVERAEQAGYACQLTKPLGTRELVDLVKNLLDAPSPPPGSSKVESRNEETLFLLSHSQCHARPAFYTREFRAETKPTPAVEDGEMDRLVNRLLELLRPELRRMLSQLTQEVVKRGTV